MEWKTVGRPGFFGRKRDEVIAAWNQQYGQGNWRIAYIWGNQVITREMALQIYEDAYYEFFKNNLAELEWLISNFSNVWDTAESNIEAGLDYNHQETTSAHLHDISIRRAILRLGVWFRGNRLLRVRSRDSEGYKFSPGNIPFHLPEMITQPEIKGWWRLLSIEDFWQRHKVLQVKKNS